MFLTTHIRDSAYGPRIGETQARLRLPSPKRKRTLGAGGFIAASSPIRTIPLHGPKEAHREQTGRAKIEPLLPPGYWTEWDADLLLLRGRDSGIVATFSARGVTQEAIEAVAWGKHGSEPTREEQLGRAAPWPRHPPG
jgi:hypothetical protein